MFKGRDGCRTPMPWVKGAANAGFTEATPWLPIDPAHNNSAVDVQEADQDSILQSYRHFLQWRKKQHLLIEGDITFIDSHPDVLAFIRSQDDQRMLVLFNLCGEQQTFALNELRLSSIIDDHGLLCGAQDILDPATIVLPSFASFYGLLG